MALPGPRGNIILALLIIGGIIAVAAIAIIALLAWLLWL